MRRDVPRNLRVAKAGLCAIATTLALAAPANASWMPNPPDPRPPDSNPHSIVESATTLHMGDAEYMAATSSGTFNDFADRFGATTNGTTAWTGSWLTRSNKPAAGQPRSMQTTVYWYRTDMRVYCSYTGTATGTDVAMTGAFYLDFCANY
jgi:hypothetical protein